MDWSVVVGLFIVACCCLACWLAFFEAKKYETDIEDGKRISKGSGYTMCLVFGIVAILMATGLLGFLGYAAYNSSASTGMMVAAGGMGILLLTIGSLLLTIAGKLKKTVQAYENGQHKGEVLVYAGQAKKSAQSFAILFSAILGLVAIAYGIKMKFTEDTDHGLPPSDGEPIQSAKTAKAAATPVADAAGDVFYDAESDLT